LNLAVEALVNGEPISASEANIAKTPLVPSAVVAADVN
jgi:hypothetical protein